MKISRKKATEKKWVTFDPDGLNIELQIRPFPVSLMKTDNNLESALKFWNYSVCDWRRIDDEETGEPFPCNSANKLFIYDVYQEAVVFVIEEVTKMSEELVDQSKN